MSPHRLASKELAIVREEEENLDRLIALAPSPKCIANREEILRQIFQLRESIGEAGKDDIAPLTEQLTRLTALANQGDRSGIDGVDIKNPYFAHMRLQEERLTRDIYLGTQTYQSPDRSIQIVDWRRSPIAVIFFRYDLGDEYEEEIGERTFEGRVADKRILKIHDGQLREIRQENLLLVKDSERNWRHVKIRNALLKGGAGTATRPQQSETAAPKLGVAPPGSLSSQKFLSAITALIDPAQFEAITRQATGIVAIQGTAGSGKTTVALHRLAWLHFQDRRRFKPEKMMALVFSRALANYISLVLPSLGIQNVTIDFFGNWISRLRRRIFGGMLPKVYSDRTPVAVIRLKKHPALLEIIQDFIADSRRLFFQRLEKAIANKRVQDFPLCELKRLPFVECLYILAGWLTGKIQFAGKPFCYGGELLNATQRLIADFVDMNDSRKEMVLQFWDALFSDFDSLENQFACLAPGEFTAQEYAEIVEWLRLQYVSREARRKKGDIRAGDVPEKATLDFEDDPILVLFYQILVGDRIGSGKRMPQYAHLMVDEAQDLCPLELTVLLKVCQKPQNLTLAGDIDQRLVRHSGFSDWDTVFRYLGVTDQKMSELRVSYRSTYEIVEFSLSVLGNLATTKDFLATRSGPPVELFGFSNQGELAYRLARHLKELINREQNASVAVICFDPECARQYHELLEKAEVPKLRLIRDQEFSFTEGIDITDVKQVKGLEFDYVILLDVDAVHYPDRSYSRYLLHIGASRAAHQLWIMNHRRHAPILPESLIRRQIE